MPQAHWLRSLLRTIPLLLVLLFMPLSSYAQSEQSGNFGLTVSDEEISSWLQREGEVHHPVMDNLETVDRATLHFYYPREYSQRAESVIVSAESARAMTLRFLPAETVANVHVYLLGSINHYFEALDAPGRAPDWAAGITLLHDGVIIIRLAPSGMVKIEPHMTLAHELNHVALRRFAQDNYFPHWFYEGLAMTATNDWNLDRAETLGRAKMTGNLLDLDGIEEAFGKKGAIVDLAYAESAHFVSWLAKSFGDDAMKKLLQDTATGTPFAQAFSKEYGRSPNAAFALWRDSMAKEESLIASLFSHDGLFFFISLFAAVGLVIALWRKNSVRKARMEATTQDIPKSRLPENLRHFGPFT